MAVRGLLDTNTVLYLLGGRLANRLEAGSYFISVITELELLSYPSLDSSEEHQIRSFLTQVASVGLTTEVRKNTILVRKENRLKLPDAIIVASAISINAVLFTNDQLLLRIPGISARSLALK